MLGFNSGVEMNLCLSFFFCLNKEAFEIFFLHSFALVNEEKTEDTGFPGTPKPGLCDLN